VIRLFSVAAFTFSLHAKTLDEQFVHQLNRATTSVKTAQLHADYRALQIARRACRVQLLEQRLPVACYEALSLEKSWHLQSKADQSRILRRLNSLCREAARNFHQRPLPRRLKPVSNACRLEVLKAARIQAYSEEARWSEN
jgi:hypothetical protein